MRAARRRTLTEVPNAVEDRAKFYTAPGPVRYAVAADGRGPLVPLPLSLRVRQPAPSPRRCPCVREADRAPQFVSAPTDTSRGGRSSGPVRPSDARGALLTRGRLRSLDNLTVWTACKEAAETTSHTGQPLYALSFPDAVDGRRRRGDNVPRASLQLRPSIFAPDCSPHI